MNISVGDVIRYTAINGAPVSGLAIEALQNGWTDKTVVMTEETDGDDELYQSIKLEKYRWRHQKRG